MNLLLFLIRWLFGGGGLRQLPIAIRHDGKAVSDIRFTGYRFIEYRNADWFRISSWVRWLFSMGIDDFGNEDLVPRNQFATSSRKQPRPSMDLSEDLSPRIDQTSCGSLNENTPLKTSMPDRL
jgi:hypothetical protein